ncbi:hypothetical protein [Pyrococcus kukulkanii]|uniref:hypothetical protein n=1 Tax=Pyrococcus kukulkanii TaxID=1609559 RepID=UPI0035663C05
MGKSSILRAYLNENPGILIDCRELYAESGHITREDLKEYPRTTPKASCQVQDKTEHEIP